MASGGRPILNWKWLAGTGCLVGVVWAADVAPLRSFRLHLSLSSLTPRTPPSSARHCPPGPCPAVVCLLDRRRSSSPSGRRSHRQRQARCPWSNPPCVPDSSSRNARWSPQHRAGGDGARADARRPSTTRNRGVAASSGLRTDGRFRTLVRSRMRAGLWHAQIRRPRNPQESSSGCCGDDSQVDRKRCRWTMSGFRLQKKFPEIPRPSTNGA